MYDQVLIPTDGSAGIEQAVGRGLALAQINNAQVHVLYVVDTRPYEGSELETDESLVQNVDSIGRQAVAAINERATSVGLDVTEVIRSGIPHVEIRSYTEANGIDCIVMGTHGRTGRDLASMGSTTDRILRESDVPVITTHLPDNSEMTTGDKERAPGDILVPTDGSDAAIRASEHAVEIAAHYGTRVHGLYVVDTSIFEYEDAPRSILGPLREGGRNALSETEALAADAGVSVTTTLSEGKPYEEIIDQLGGTNADLVVMGRRGRTGLPEVLLGSTTLRIIRLAESPVLSVT